jgi:hypothetical protein
MNIRKLIIQLEAIAALSGEDQTVDIFCPEALDWYPITGFTYGGGDNKVRIYNDEE